MHFDENPLTLMQKRKEKGLRISDSALLLVVFNGITAVKGLNVLAATWYSWNWQVKARGRSTYSTFLLKSYHPLWTRAFLLLQSKLQALTGWQVLFIHLDYIMLYLEQVKTKALCHFNHTIMLTHDLSEIRFRWSSSKWLKQLVYQCLYWAYV